MGFSLININLGVPPHLWKPQLESIGFFDLHMENMESEATVLVILAKIKIGYVCVCNDVWWLVSKSGNHALPWSATVPFHWHDFGFRAVVNFAFIHHALKVAWCQRKLPLSPRKQERWIQLTTGHTATAETDFSASFTKASITAV